MKTFLVKVRKEDAPETYSVPGHPEFSWLKTVSDRKWYARDGKNGNFVTIVKKVQDMFVSYAITYTE